MAIVQVCGVEKNGDASKLVISFRNQEFKDHYHHERPHQGLENELIQIPPTKKRKKTEPNVDTILLSDIRCEERLGGLQKCYSRVAG